MKKISALIFLLLALIPFSIAASIPTIDSYVTDNAGVLSQSAKYKLETELKELEKTLIILSLKYKETIQVGRTHGQHAVPITFGFAIALVSIWLASRMTRRHEALVADLATTHSTAK